MIKPGNPKYRFLYAVWAFFECLFFGGLIYGWASLVVILKDEGFYSDLCSPVDQNATFSNSSKAGDCDERDSSLALIFTIGSSLFGAGCFLMGQISYKFGTRITRLTACVTFIAGALLIGFADLDVPWLLFPGLICIGVGGIAYLMTNTQIAVLFPTGGSVFVGILCGAFDSSTGVQQLIKIGYENGISRQTSYIILAVAHILTLFSTFFFLPKDVIQDKHIISTEETEDLRPDKKALDGYTSENVDRLNDGLLENKTKVSPDDRKPSLFHCMFSFLYVPHLIWLGILQLRFYFFLGSINKILQDTLRSDDEVSEYTDIMYYTLMCGLISSPLAGFVYDIHVRLFRNSKSQFRQNVMPAVAPLAITTTICLVMSILVLIEDRRVLIPIFVCVLLFRSFLYTMGAGFLSKVFPSEYFGIMYGILILTAGITCLLQYAFFNWAEKSGFFQPNLLLLILSIVTYAHPIIQWISSRRHESVASV